MHGACGLHHLDEERVCAAAVRAEFETEQRSVGNRFDQCRGCRIAEYWTNWIGRREVYIGVSFRLLVEVSYGIGHWQ